MAYMHGHLVMLSTNMFSQSLSMSYMFGTDGRIFTNRSGVPLYQLNRDLCYYYCINEVSFGITVPEGFITDLASIPRLPFIYLILNGVADMPGVLHDYLYSCGKYDRAECDKIFLDAMLSIGISKWKAYAIYTGVRLFGASHYNTDM